MSTQFWGNDITVLFKQQYITEIFPKHNSSTAQKLNAISTVYNES